MLRTVSNMLYSQSSKWTSKFTSGFEFDSYWSKIKKIRYRSTGTSSKESVEKLDADGMVYSEEGGEVVAFAKFGDEKKSGEALLVSFAFQ